MTFEKINVGVKHRLNQKPIRSQIQKGYYASRNTARWEGLKGTDEKKGGMAQLILKRQPVSLGN